MQASVLEWLEQTSRLMPQKIAIHDENGELSFQQYYRKSISIACAVLDICAGTKRPIAVYLEKSYRSLVSFMGIAYSGNFYSPIDTDMPLTRVNKILEILSPSLVITTRTLSERFEHLAYNGPMLFFEDVSEVEDSTAVSDAKNKIIDTDLLYVLFTSGSTGVPKGVCISHRSVIDYIDQVTIVFSICAEDSFGNQAPFYFDNSILDIYATMKNGATLYIIPPKLFSQPIRLLDYLKRNCINTIFWVPSALIVVAKLRAFRNIDLTDVLKRVLFCGEVMPNRQLNMWRKFLPNLLYANLYGPTEITDACTYFIVDREFQDDEALPIGNAFQNTEVMVIDESNRLVTEPWEKGELCVCGSSLARGYYRNVEMTKKSFVQNPLQNNYDEIIYRTGDIVQYNDRMELMYLSRKDFQIKHLGHRIELGEIETAVSSIPGISQCCCLYNERQSKIILFIDRDLSKDVLLGHLRSVLPEYMIPGKIHILQNMPLNANGKIDRVELRKLL